MKKTYKLLSLLNLIPILLTIGWIVFLMIAYILDFNPEHLSKYSALKASIIISVLLLLLIIFKILVYKYNLLLKKNFSLYLFYASIIFEVIYLYWWIGGLYNFILTDKHYMCLSGFALSIINIFFIIESLLLYLKYSKKSN